MKIMQYLYVLTSTPKDNYYEQFLLSLVSLRLLMPDAYVILLCDSKTKNTLIDKRKEYEKYISKVVSVKAPDTLSQVEVSRWLKTSMRRLIEGSFLFIDCDTIITEDLSSISKLNISIGGCLDCHSLLDKHHNKKMFKENEKKLGFSSHLSNKQINSGIIFCSDTPDTHKIFDRWHELWLFSKDKNIIRDQPSLNMAIYENESCFTELDGTWNCQIISNYLPFLVNAKIIHYFATKLYMYTSPYIFASEDIFNKIKEMGTIPDFVYKLLQNPKSAFVSETRIYAGEYMFAVLDSDLFKTLFFLKKLLPFIFNSLNAFFSLLKKFGKLFLIRRNKRKNAFKYYN